MRKFLMVPAILLLCSAWAVAQNGGSGSLGSSSTGNDNQKTIEGCLSGSANNFSLTDSSGKTYQLQGDTSKLNDQIGHQVRIQGTEAGASASATTSSGETASASTSKSGNNPSSNTTTSPSGGTSTSGGTASAAIQFKVDTVQRVSDTCSPSSR